MANNKTVRLVEPRGFCFGVKKALKILDEAIMKYPDKQIYVVNEIVHNKIIINDYQNKGIIFTQDYESIPENSVVVFSAHGVSPEVRKTLREKQIIILDATCPKVQRVHDEAIQLADNGYHIIYIGNAEHDEGRGVIAEAPEKITVVRTEADISNIPRGLKNYAILTQTTLNLYEVEEVYQKIKRLIPEVEFPERNNLCRATTERQIAVKNNSEDCDLMLVLGSGNSSNSKRLQEIAERICPRSFLIDSHDQLQIQWLKNADRVCITAGASAPEYLVEDLLSVLIKDHGYKLA